MCFKPDNRIQMWLKVSSCRFFTLVLVCFSVLVVGEVRADSGSSSSNYEKALTAQAEGELQKAIIHLKNELQSNPSNVSARLLLGRIYIDKGDGTSAERELTQARRQGVDKIIVVPLLGEALLLQDVPQRVIDEVLPGYGDDRVEAEIQVLRGRAYLGLQKPLQAEEAFLLAIQKNPNDLKAYVGLASVKANQQLYTEALDYIRQAQTINPTDKQVLTTLADIQRLTGNIDDALANYSRAIAQDGENGSARLNRAGMLIDLGRIEEAEEDVVYVLSRAPFNPKAKYLQAELLFHKGDREAANTALVDAASILSRIEPASLSSRREVAMLSGMVAFRRMAYEEAVKRFETYVSLTPGDNQGLRLLSAALIRQGNLSGAVDHLRNVIVSEPDSAAAHSLLGQAYFGLGDLTYALDALERSVSIDPNMVDSHIYLGRVYQARGQTDLAIASYAETASRVTDRRGLESLMASTYLDAGRGKEALAIIQPLLDADPDDAQAHNLAGLALGYMGDKEEAIRHFVLASDLDPASPEASLNLAKLYLGTGAIDEAAARFRIVLKRDARNIEALLGMGQVAASRQQAEKAAGWFNRARVAAPENPASWVYLINLKGAQDDYKGAIALAEDFLKQYPEHYMIRRALGLAQVKANKLTDATQSYEILTDTAPDRGEAYYQLAVVRQMAGDTLGARKNLTNAIVWDTENTQAYIALIQLEAKEGNLDRVELLEKELRALSPDLADAAVGQAYLAARQGNKAMAVYRNGLARDKNSWVMTSGLFQSYLATGNYPDAIQLMESWRRKFPDHMDANVLLASSYLRAGEYMKATSAYEKLLVAYPENPGFLNDLAWAYQQTGDERALEIAEKAYKIAPQSPSVADTYGWILLEKGQADKALPILREAQLRDAGNPVIQYHMAAVLEALGRKAESLKAVRKALQMSTAFPGVDDARALENRLGGS